ncbi:Gfo/Idh/MocA family oxidoreductase [Amycolatopsis acidiphila]|uniref:Inositol 2-dehydrogenase n=1 Tax=Amycolatopsis acidiphila TaxID=715473 RepID=A0A558AGM7_9PSEU|nr:Gfo/Idh/MocA family oxidoreductase [Amycolatopsis acidiphila]TVT23420.1 inositol 2-dehydrogenase [Amycolatopsis acidiphila]UIJ59870.1 Gfo/Idh/MocA family oxidoreductase [Amycolatopsis acidiphila]GHG62715.1 inositol 2-dehydrogenase [Amycolatopsis acidiphila]
MTVHIGVIGTGMIGQDHIRRITDVVTGAEVVAMADLDADRARQVAAGVGARALANGHDVIDDPLVDAVVVTSWGPTHAEYVLGAIAAGKPVFCEKPLATKAEDCLRIVEAEQAFGRRLVQVGFMRRYDAGYRAMKQVIESGEIGAPLVMHCVHRNATVPETYHSDMAVQDTAVHELDIIRWLLGEDIVSAQVIKPRRTSRRFEHLQDPQLMLFETASGVRVDLEVFVNCRYGYDIQCETVGETGVVRLPDPADVWVRTASHLRTNVLQDWKPRFAAAFDLEFVEWVASVRDGTAAGPSAWDGYATAVLSDTTTEALHSGRVVSVRLKDRPAFYGG